MGAWPGAVNVSGATLRTQTVNVTRPPGATWFLVARDRGSVSARRTVCVADPVLAWKPEGAQVALSLHWSYRLEGRPPGSDLSGRPGVDAVHVMGRLLERHRRLGGPDRLLRARSPARTPRPAAHDLACCDVVLRAGSSAHCRHADVADALGLAAVCLARLVRAARQRLHECTEMVERPALVRLAELLVGRDHRVAVVPVQPRLGVQPERAPRALGHTGEDVGPGVAAVGARVAEHDHRRPR